MKKYDGWIIALITLVFIAIPGIVGVWMLMDTDDVEYGFMWLIAPGAILWAFLIAFTAFKLEVSSIEIFNFALPIGLVIASLFVTIEAPWWVMLICVIAMIIMALPVNMAVTRYKEAKIQSAKEARGRK